MMMALVIGSRVFTWLTLLDYLGLMNTWDIHILVICLLHFMWQDKYLVATMYHWIQSRYYDHKFQPRV